MGENIMIEKFVVYNYKGFNEEIVLDLSKTRDYAFNLNLIKNGLVNKGIIYGKNGSGKSNLGFALYDLTTHLTDKQKPRHEKRKIFWKRFFQFWCFQFSERVFLNYIFA